MSQFGAAPRLVGSSKSSTVQLPPRVPSSPPPAIPEPYESFRKDESVTGRYLTLKCEHWRAIKRTSEGALYTPLYPENAVWSAVVTTETKRRPEPPRHSGDRYTKRLSDRGKKAIEHSAKYMHCIGNGYRTFLTLTFNQKWRDKLIEWDNMNRGDDDRSTMGASVTEFLNVLQNRHRNGKSFAGHFRRGGKQLRGGEYQANGAQHQSRVTTWTKSSKWTPIKWREAFKLDGDNQPFEFVWVAENPWSVEYLDVGPGRKLNPHVHILFNWHVKLDQFHAWAHWIEQAWGKGFAKLERIKKPAAAANYMAKAANYISKGNEGSQGLIRGNRYGVAKAARAPKTRTIGVYFAGWIKSAIYLGHTTMKESRDKIPKGLWFHRYGFGASSRDAWATLWRALKADGFELEPAPVTLASARLANAGSELLSRYWRQSEEKQYSRELLRFAEQWEPVELEGVH